MQADVLSLLAARTGHIRYESGHHGTLWLDLELLFLHPRRIRPFAAELAHRLSAYQVEAICGPLVEGAFVAQMVAEELDLPFSYAQPETRAGDIGLYPVRYRIPAALRPTLSGKSVAIVNDVINAGSAVGGAYADLVACGARPVVIATLLTLGSWTSRFVADNAIGLETLAALPGDLWTPADCPLCAAGMPLDGAVEP